ncbi:MAG: hypothetical protein IJX04_10500 [Oscillospiraceae bacterium]|nr:hypothetical protein [Oscillospiraceae bacterium]
MKLKLPKLTWRTRKRLKTSAIVLGSIAALSTLLWVCWVLWLGRFVVYSRDGVRLDFDWVTPGSFVAAVPPEEPTINIRYDDGDEPVVEKSRELEKLTGCTISIDMLTGDIAELDEAIRQQPKGTAIALELKSGSGNFYYKTSMPKAKVSSKVDTDALGVLLDYLAKADYYTIAMVPAFRDRAYGLDNTSYGIHHSSGRYLWAGDDKCYWLDPAKNGTRAWLVEIASELRDLGFDEVVFTDFCFPPTEDILYEGDKLAVLNETAEHLVYNLATEDFCVSFLCSVEGFRLPEGRTRLYRDKVDASMAQSVAEGVAVPDTQINLVYLTEAMDTRFDAYSVLRPLQLGVTPLPQPTEPQATESQEPAADSPAEPVPEGA